MGSNPPSLPYRYIPVCYILYAFDKTYSGMLKLGILNLEVDMVVAVCDSCLMIAEEEGVPEGEESMVMREMGSEVADHLCDQIESDGDIQCACACHPRKRSASWRGKAKDLTPEAIQETYQALWSTPRHNYLDTDGKPLVG